MVGAATGFDSRLLKAARFQPERDNRKRVEIVIVVFGSLLAMCSDPVDTKGGNPCYPQEPDVIDGEIFCR